MGDSDDLAVAFGAVRSRQEGGGLRLADPRVFRVGAFMQAAGCAD